MFRFTIHIFRLAGRVYRLTIHIFRLTGRVFRLRLFTYLSWPDACLGWLFIYLGWPDTCLGWLLTHFKWLESYLGWFESCLGWLGAGSVLSETCFRWWETCSGCTDTLFKEPDTGLCWKEQGLYLLGWLVTSLGLLKLSHGGLEAVLCRPKDFFEVLDLDCKLRRIGPNIASSRFFLFLICLLKNRSNIN